VSDKPKLRMDAYYYGFCFTGSDAVDLVLSAVACAGKAYHHTECWQEESEPWEGHEGTTPAEWIQSAANKAAARIAALEQALSEKDAEIARLRVKADRYDWLRAGNYPIELARSILNDTPHGIDAAIDAAQGEKHAD